MCQMNFITDLCAIMQLQETEFKYLVIATQKRELEAYH